MTEKQEEHNALQNPLIARNKNRSLTISIHIAEDVWVLLFDIIPPQKGLHASEICLSCVHSGPALPALCSSVRSLRVGVFGGDPNKRTVEKLAQIVAEGINALEPEFEQLSDEALRASRLLG